ncbi:LuxR family transcriptional regulator [Ectothiorhodospiraceae bacterium WFHF3C12]|nr:LuxR family transcriptional regulator [Ectothiorhodospiraceae bacterium WFHF3C12]
MDDLTLPEIIESSLQASSVEDLHALCRDICESNGFDYFIYGARFPTSLVKPFVLIVSGYPDEWRERYVERHYIATDPTVTHCVNSVRPLVWDELENGERATDFSRRFMGEARTFGLRSGVSMPVHGGRGEVAMLSLSSEQSMPAVRGQIHHALPDLYLLSAYVHEAASRLVSAGKLPFKREELTERERECLLWAAEGKTSWETAHILGISERTVNFHLQNVANKLNVTSRQQAIARAVAQGLIVPQFN